MCVLDRSIREQLRRLAQPQVLHVVLVLQRTLVWRRICSGLYATVSHWLLGIYPATGSNGNKLVA